MLCLRHDHSHQQLTDITAAAAPAAAARRPSAAVPPAAVVVAAAAAGRQSTGSKVKVKVTGSLNIT